MAWNIVASVSIVAHDREHAVVEPETWRYWRGAGHRRARVVHPPVQEAQSACSRRLASHRPVADGQLGSGLPVPDCLGGDVDSVSAQVQPHPTPEFSAPDVHRAPRDPDGRRRRCDRALDLDVVIGHHRAVRRDCHLQGEGVRWRSRAATADDSQRELPTPAATYQRRLIAPTVLSARRRYANALQESHAVRLMSHPSRPATGVGRRSAPSPGAISSARPGSAPARRRPCHARWPRTRRRSPRSLRVHAASPAAPRTPRREPAGAGCLPGPAECL